MRTIILSCILVLMGFSAYAQDAVRGKVVDKHGNPIPGVKLEIKGGQDSVFSGLDGTFILSPSVTHGSLEAYYSGMKPARTRISKDMTVTMRPENWWNREPYRHSFFISFQTGVRMDAFGTPTAPSLGIMFGTVKRWGWYIRALTWLDSYDYAFNPTGYMASGNEDIAPGYWWTTGRTKKNHTILTVGAIARLGCALHLYFGAGLALAQDLYELADGSWVGTEPYMTYVPINHETWEDVEPIEAKGAFVADLGLMLRLDFVVLNVGTSYLGNIHDPSPDLPGNWTLNTGVGFIF